VIIPHIGPADIREIQRILSLMGLEYTLIPDYSMTLDRPYGGRYQKIPPGGTRTEDIARMPGAPLTIQFGETCPDALSPGLWLNREFGVPLVNLPLPIGLEATDWFIDTLHTIGGIEVPKSLVTERGWLLDGMADAHKFNAEGRSVIYGEPELVYAVTRICCENGVVPAVIASGSGNDRLARCLETVLSGVEETPVFIENPDFAAIEAAALSSLANIAIGHSGGKFLTERHGIPVVRIGFPVHDRIGGQRILSAGYTGSLAFLDRITNTLLETKYASFRNLRREEMAIKGGA
jgi:nitrogenase molybdenum-iron protein NifN